MYDKGFYRAFEEHFRGSREIIKERLKVYLPFITPFKDIYADCRAIDLGCGRGEWLELMTDTKFIHPHGVDLDEGMLSACVERGLSAAKADAITSLKLLPDESQVIVSGFHIAEHIPFESLQMLIKEALRVLKPGGQLILETPNPENIVVGTSNFYLDPTHQRPIPSQLLAFLVDYSGFGRTKILRLQESPELREARHVGLPNVISGVSPDYALIAQKMGLRQDMALFDEPFGRSYGISLDDLSTKYEAGIQVRLAKLEERLLVLWRIATPLRFLYELMRRITRNLRKSPKDRQL